MNKDRAIQMLERMQDPGPYEPQITSEAFDALQMAIEALKYSEIPNSSDTISRQAAIDYFVTNVGFNDEDGYPIEDECELREIWKEYFDGIPPAEPERIKGHWIEIALSNHTYKCSVCGRLLVNITDGKNNVAKNYPYCHCGADMRGEQK